MDWKAQLLELAVKYALPLFFTGLSTGLGWVFLRLGKWLDGKAATSKLAAAAAKAEHFADAAVHDVLTDLEPMINSAASDGQTTPDELAAIKAEALKKLKAILSEKGLSLLSDELGLLLPGLDTYLSGLVGKALVKSDAVPPPSSTELKEAAADAKAPEVVPSP